MLTVEAEVSKERRNEVNGEAEANTDICNVLHPGLTRSETQTHNSMRTFSVYADGEHI